jgi:hypothetical protein
VLKERSRLSRFIDALTPTRHRGTTGRVRFVRTGGGRQSVDEDQASLFNSFSSTLAIQTPYSSSEYWRNANLDSRSLRRLSPARLIELLADVSPDVSRALWDFMLFMCPGFEVDVFRPGTETPYPSAKKKLLEFFDNLHGPFTSDRRIPLEVIFASMFMGVFLRGAFLAELVLDEEGRTPLEIATPDPLTITAKRVKDPRHGGTVWQIGQWQRGKWVALDRETIFYIPVHPFPGRPFGRPLVASAVFSTLFLVGLLHDIRRVVSQQGYPRLDIIIDFDKLQPPADATPGSEAESKWVEETIAYVSNFYEQLEPEDAFVHSGAITVNKQPVGTLNSNSLGQLDSLIKMIERQAVRGLKSMTVLFSINDATSESMVNRQWRIYVAGIQSFQHMAENILQHLSELALQVQGIVGDVRFRFAELIASDEYIQAQTDLLRMTTARYGQDNGYWTPDEACFYATGKTTAASQTPLDAGNYTNAQTMNGDTDGEKSALRGTKLPRDLAHELLSSQTARNGNGHGYQSVNGSQSRT